MKKIILIFLVFVSLREILSHKYNRSGNQVKRLRSFNVFPEEFWDLKKAYEIKQRLLEEKERKKLEIEKNLFRKKADEQRKIFQIYLGSRNKGSSFHTDFHTERFF
jgi:hypothetical protein